MKPKMSRVQIVRLRGLLNMEYSPSELAHEIGFNVDTLYSSYLPAGCPHRRDETGHIWIVGRAFAEWAHEMFVRRKEPLEIGEGQAYCFKCAAVVRMLGPIKVTPTNRYLELVTGTCEFCGHIVNKARKR